MKEGTREFLQQKTIVNFTRIYKTRCIVKIGFERDLVMKYNMCL